MYSVEVENRFWSRVEKGDINECWECVGMLLNGKGYGRFSINNKNIFAHRVSFQLHHNRLIQDGMIILHSCDNPSCVNPHHLSEGTHQDNATDRRKKGRGAVKLTEVQIREIRQKYNEDGISHRQLGIEYGVSHRLIGGIVKLTRWKHIE
jgi:hypothetical protein